MKLVRILLPITQHGTTEACADAAFGFAECSGAQLEVLHPCPALAERLPYSTELSAFYFEELIDVGKKQVALEKRLARNGSAKAAHEVIPRQQPNLVSIEDLVAPSVAMRAKVADLDGPAEHRRSSGRILGERALCRPVPLGAAGSAMPKQAEGPIGETVVIAWKDLVEAVRAVAAAQPFLAKAKRIKLVGVTESGQDKSGAAMAEVFKEGRPPR